MIILEAKNLSKVYVHGKKITKAVSDVSLIIQKGQTVGLVGESGCGKSTLGQMLTKLVPPSNGNVFFKGKDLLTMSKQELFITRRHLQIIFQDPYSSLNPRLNIAKILAEPLKIHNLVPQDLEGKLEELLHLVGLDPSYLKRYPHELSGGQRQRIGIARTLALYPECVICDEPVSALDISIQAQIIQLLKNLQESLHLSYLFISHNLNVVRYMSKRVAVMYLGTIVEEGPSEQIYENPSHPYTQMLLTAAQSPFQKKQDPLSLYKERAVNKEVSQGCVFAPKCPKATSLCKEHAPFKKEIAPEHFTRCHHI